MRNKTVLKVSKRERAFPVKVQPGKVYPIQEAVNIVKTCATAKFNESVDIAVNLGIDARKSEQSIRGAVVLPHGTGQKVRVAVFTQGNAAQAAKDAGADIVGFEDLAEAIKQGKMDFDILIATPDAMRVVGQLGQILGPRGLMPNPKVGTVTPDVATAVKNAKAGQVQYRTDKNGIIHCTVGKAGFTLQALQENIEILVADLRRLKPSTAKGVYFKKLVISSTMGPGVLVDVASLAGAST